jgi:hypothetical protein
VPSAFPAHFIIRVVPCEQYRKSKALCKSIIFHPSNLLHSVQYRVV